MCGLATDIAHTLLSKMYLAAHSLLLSLHSYVFTICSGGSPQARSV